MSLHLVVAHLDDQLRTHPRLVQLAGAPAVRLGDAAFGRILQQRQQPFGDLLPLAGRNGARADVVEPAVVAVEAEEQRRDLGLVALPPDSEDGAVGGSVLFDLDYGVARARLIRGRQTLCDDPVEPERLEALEPRARSRGRSRCG